VAVSSSSSATITATRGTTHSATLTVNAPTAVPSAPTLLAPASGASVPLPVTLDWNDVPNAASYQIQVDDGSSFSSPRVVDQSVTASQLTVPTLANRQHWWRVRGRNSAGTAGSWSTVRSFTPQGTQAAAALSAITVSPSSLTGGTGATGTATLTGAAPSGGAVIALASSQTSAASVPSSVTIAAGATSATFAVSTAAVSTTTTVSLSGTYAGVTRSAALTVNPAGSTTTAVLTVTATGRSGNRIVSSPAGIDVSVGTTGSASFAAGTRITLSVSSGRDAIWSGACSSGGNKRRTCTFTLNGNASVTANVQ
jgi:hypothetical protein